MTNQPVQAHSEAEEHLRYIRDVMERSSEFSAISGVGVIFIGVMAIVLAVVSMNAGWSDQTWLTVWIAAAAISILVGTMTTLRKARDSGTPITVGPTRKFALCLLPAIVVGAALTASLVSYDLYELMPAMWLLVYGAGITAGATYSSGHLYRFGMGFILVGLAALTSPQEWADVAMLVGFGVVHLAMGIWIARKYGG